MESSSIKGYVVYPTYRIIEEEADGKKVKKPKVYLFGRLENGESFLSISSFVPYFYIRRDDFKRHHERLSKLLGSYRAETEESNYVNFDDESVIKVLAQVPGDIAKLRKELENINIECYEADIRFYQRFLIDHDIKGSLEIIGQYKKGNHVDRIYEEPKLKGTDWMPELRVLSIDIETDKRAKSIYCISFYTEKFNDSPEYKKVLIVAKDKDLGKPLHDALSLGSEKELIEKFQELVLKIDPDIITGWNMIDFDLKIIKQKFEEHKLPFVLGRIDWPCKLDITGEFMRDSSADFPGRVVLDGITMLRTSFVKLENYKLDTAAEEFLGEKKLIGSENKGDDIERYYKSDQQKLIDYNLKDSEFVYKIIYKTSALQLTILRSLVTGMTLDRVKASVASLDSLFLRYARKRGIVLGNSKFSEKEEPGKGGFVMDSKPGLYDYVIVCDFKSLYPSIIRTFNIDPYSYVSKEKRPKHLSKDRYVTASNGAVFKNQEGILPKVIEDVWKQRDAAKKRKDTAETIYALKIIMNSFYGVLSNPSCRFFNLDISNAITYTGQSIIQLSAKKVEELGYKVIYGDTDSIFVVSGSSNADDAAKIGRKIQKYINEFYDGYIKTEYNRNNVMELQFEKLFKVFLMPTIRGSDEGAKKRYAGIIIDDKGEESLHFTGMESVRGDWTELAKSFQAGLFERVFNKREYSSYVQDFVSSLKNGMYDDLLIYKKNINKPLSEYIKITPPHVKAARMLDNLTSNQIRYVITINGPEPIEKLKHKPDYEHYIDKQLRPIADTILSVYGKNFYDILKKSKQSSLFSF